MGEEVTAAKVKELREVTGGGMMDCKKALVEASGDMEAAQELLRKWGLKDIGKRSGKVAAEGVVGMYSHSGGQIAAIVELNCETDFVARGDEFQDTARGLAMHVAALDPDYLCEECVPEDVLAKEREILMETLNDKQKEMADKILPGKLKKFFEENCFLNQVYVKADDDKSTVQDVVEALSAKVGEKVTVRRFARFEVGEGIEKQEANLAEEVAATIAGS